MNPSPLIIGHRGASAYAPENTMAAFRLALAQGCDGVEFDVHLAADGVPVVIHDSDLKRTGGNDARVADLTSKELGAVDVGSWFNRARPGRSNDPFGSETVPTLEAVIELLAVARAIIYLELKCGGGDFRELTSAVCSQLARGTIPPQLIIKSFSAGAISQVRSELPQAPTALLIEPTTRTLFRRRAELVKLAAETGAHRLSLHWSLVNKRMAQAAADAGLPITVWTVDSPRWISKARALGVDALITNDPPPLLKAREIN